jgi:WD40 repeat protein
MLASGSHDHTIRLWDLAGWKLGEPQPPSRVLSGHGDNVWSIAFSPDGSLLATSSTREGRLFLWDTASGRKVHELAGHSRVWPLVAFSPDGATLAAGAENGAVNLWDVRSGRRQEPLRYNDGPVRAVAFSNDGRLLATGDGHNVQVIDLKAGRWLYTFPQQTLCTRLAFSEDSKLLAGTSDAPDPRLRLWDVETGKELAACGGHTNHIIGLALQPGGQLAATGSWDYTVRLWDLASSGKEVQKFDFHGGGPVNEVAFSPEGRYVAVALSDATIALMRLAGPGSR